MRHGEMLRGIVVMPLNWDPSPEEGGTGSP